MHATVLMTSTSHKLIFLIIMLAIISIGLASTPSSSAMNGSCYQYSSRSGLATYYINRNADAERRVAIETHLNILGLPFQRIPAIEQGSEEYNLLMLEKPCKRNSETDIATIMSHIKAIYTAVYTPMQIPKEKKRGVLDNYALIVEDDAKFLYDIDFEQLILTAPRKFGVLQLVTSNPEAVETLWYTYNTAHCCNTSVTYTNPNGAHILECAQELGELLPSDGLRKACTGYKAIESSFKPRKKKTKRKNTSPRWNEDDYIEPPAFTRYVYSDGNPHRRHDENAMRYWRPHRWDDLSKNGRTTLYWSAQAYIINRRSAWRFLADVVVPADIAPVAAQEPATMMIGTGSKARRETTTSGLISTLQPQQDANKNTNTLTTTTTETHTETNTNKFMGFKLVNSFSPGSCQRTEKRPCVLAHCLFSHTYIFSAAQPTHVSLLPLLGTTRKGLNTTQHPELAADYRRGFSRIKEVTSLLRGDKLALLPSYLRVPPAHCRSSGGGGRQQESSKRTALSASLASST